MRSASGYVGSKLAATKIYETFDAENSQIEVTHIHPGVVYSELNVKSGVTATDDGMCRQLYLCLPLMRSQLICQLASLCGPAVTKASFCAEEASTSGVTGTSTS
jgi:hypothetical protein